eukprot:350235-Chlamydomonas_euryale.AAC.10
MGQTDPGRVCYGIAMGAVRDTRNSKHLCCPVCPDPGRHQAASAPPILRTFCCPVCSDPGRHHAASTYQSPERTAANSVPTQTGPMHASATSPQPASLPSLCRPRLAACSLQLGHCHSMHPRWPADPGTHRVLHEAHGRRQRDALAVKRQLRTGTAGMAAMRGLGVARQTRGRRAWGHPRQMRTIIGGDNCLKTACNKDSKLSQAA